MGEILFKAKAVMPCEELNELEIDHVCGWVTGHLVGKWIVGSPIDIEEGAILPEFYVEIDPATVEQVYENEEYCISCNKPVGDGPVFWDVSGGYWCEPCGLKDIIYVMQKQLDATELAEAKARMDAEQMRENIFELREYIGQQPHSDLLEYIVDILYDISQGKVSESA